MKTITKFTCLASAALAFSCFAVLSTAQAVTPPPDGGYPGANTAEGDNALLNLTTGIANTAVGNNALHDNTTGGWNVAIGSSALASNTTGQQNMAVGTEALTNSNASFNLAIGFRVGYLNTTGSHLTGIGAAALRNNTTGSDNTAIGVNALGNNTTGNRLTGIGAGALYNNTDGYANTANGFQALYSNVGGSLNTAVGPFALFSNHTGHQNTAVGYAAGYNVITANNVICIGRGVSGANVTNTTWIGNIYGVNTLRGTTAPVIVSNTGQLGTVASSERFKKDIAAMERASEAILSLRPVTFHYKADAENTPQFGLIAEEVAKVNPALVLPDKEGKPYTVRYDAVNAMLLNEFLKEHRAVQELKSTVAKQEAIIAKQQKGMEAVTARLDQQAAQIQKVSAQLELSKAAPQTVLNRQ